MEETTCAELINITPKMKSKTNAGYDNILTQLMNQFVESIALPLKTMFNSMIRSGIFPNDLIIAKDSPNPVMPVFFTNYRPISLLSAFSKIFEILIDSLIDSFLEKYKILFASQYVFRKQCSTEHATLALIDSTANALNDKQYALALFFDLRKAFDTLGHTILFDKLWYYGIRGVPHKRF